MIHRMSIAAHRTRYCICSLLLCCLGGCLNSDQVTIAPVVGQVKIDGQPVVNAVIAFEDPATGFAAMGKIETDGKYVLRSQYGNGIPPGEYRVTVSPPPSRDDQDREIPPVPGATKIPPKFQQGATSGMTANVEDGENTLDFDLTTSS